MYLPEEIRPDKPDRNRPKQAGTEEESVEAVVWDIADLFSCFWNKERKYIKI